MAFAQRFPKSLVVFSLALLVVVCFADEINRKPDDDETIRSDDVSARVKRLSGKIQVVRDNDGDSDDSGDDDDDDDNDDDDDDDDDGGDDDDDDFSDDNEDLLSFELDGIEEKDADGNDVGTLERHSVDSFDNTVFQMSPVKSDSSFQGISATNVNISAYLDDPNANLDVMVYLFREAGNVKFGSESFKVQAGTVKFNIKISNWNFCKGFDCSEGKDGEYLDLKLKIKSKGTPEEVDDEDRMKTNKEAVCEKNDNDNDANDANDDDDCPIIYDMGGDSEMLLNRGVMNDDDKYTAMPAGFPKMEIEDGEMKFKFRIPKFNQNSVIDPSVTPGKVSSSSAARASWIQISMIILLLEVAALFLAQ